MTRESILIAESLVGTEKKGVKSKRDGIGTSESFCLTDAQLEREREEMEFFGRFNSSQFRPPATRLIGSGSWVCITKTVPVDEAFQPMLWGIYWATPCMESKNFDGYDSKGRYKIEVLVKHKNMDAFEVVGLMVDEYSVISESKLAMFIEDGYQLQRSIDTPDEEPLNLELLERGRALTEEEREIILALQIDGLTETQACQEYFMGRHVAAENKHIWYKPSDELLEALEGTFGRR